jgi:ribulose-bisphosphate carboxylase large chain
LRTFTVQYDITVLEGESIGAKVEGICFEQSVEMPPDTIDIDIHDEIVGRILLCEKTGESRYRAEIEWPLLNTGPEITQFLNVLYGNISMKPGICITGLSWEKLAGVPSYRQSDSDQLFPGPAYGIPGIRERLGIPERPLSATALKPMGLTATELADICYRFALGGIDIIKDDHGLADQPYAPFRERVKACMEAMQRAADKTGRNSMYIPNITGDWPEMVERFEIARDHGAGGVMISPHLTGLWALAALAQRDDALPLAAHPAFSGSHILHAGSGFTKAFLYGELWRALGADLIIYPNAGGRFSYSREECLAINEAARRPMAGFRSSFPMPGGGMQRANLPEWVRAYGPDTVYLLGGSLYQHPEGIEAAAREISELLAG